MAKRKLERVMPDYIEEAIKTICDRLADIVKDKIKREIRGAFNDKDTMRDLITTQENMLGKFNRDHLEELQKKHKVMVKEMERISKANEVVEQTLLNVLVAIRQNEYLQAWYPAQQGYPAMKVVGEHPIQAERRRNSEDSNTRPTDSTTET